MSCRKRTEVARVSGAFEKNALLGSGRISRQNASKLGTEGKHNRIEFERPAVSDM